MSRKSLGTSVLNEYEMSIVILYNDYNNIKNLKIKNHGFYPIVGFIENIPITHQ